jgi:hypothetical protein
MFRLASLLIGFVLGFVVAALLGPHLYGGATTGVVLWNCGPRVEVAGHPGVYWDQCR